MPTNPHRHAALLLVALLVGASCGCGGDATKPKKGKPEKPIVPADVDAESAVRVDEGRISVAPPVDWKREPKSKDYLARYVPGGGRTYPSVTVLGGDPPAGITAVDGDNHAAFVTAVAESLADQFTGPNGKSTLLKKPAAVELGPHKGVVWTAPGRAKVGGQTQDIERSCAAVVVAGRMYTVEARAPKGKLDDAGRAAGRGVAAGIAAAEDKPAEPEPDKPADDKPADDKPAEEKPADTKPADEKSAPADKEPAPAEPAAPAAE